MTIQIRTMSKGFYYSITSSFLWACGLVISRFVLRKGENPLNLTTWIYLVTLVPWLFFLYKHGKEFKKLSTRLKLLLIFIGIAGSLGINYLQSLALSNTSAVNFAFLYRTIVVFTILFAWMFFKEKITTKKAILVIFILIGSYLLTTNGKGISLTKGDIYTLLMAASAAFIANILIKHTVSKMHPDLSGSVTSVVAISSLFIIALRTRVLKMPHDFLLIFMAGAIYFIQIMLRNRAYKVATASFVTMIVSLTPLFVGILSYFFLGETIEFVGLIGGLLIVGSTIFVEKFKI